MPSRKKNNEEKVQEVKGEQEDQVKGEQIPTLEFLQFGWCRELNFRFQRGFYKPKNREEYEALKKYAK